ncbi:hypothetical protein VOLCADRAFT_104665 [Volvox carteri f. nagariensis]|uniref:AB hydrolase-1 domain-containing protein n=1 Tax=Volvox carteri f. nagariensis TaxID=3068 RepID=D8TVM8_VOLCA|nr:uncharacterized protein VOLCADRAFT_104665 [Volvox carteri f. nagariensis]EFJ48611.1 hypothetical protein VOLCADRAFT_104665 [Volvox carteri f. nagariensis]|eukprot:XP_002950410.1 hypothetical protein VOLCADRAFT_104665 [Volvox carteri f. nagariensis]
MTSVALFLLAFVGSLQLSNAAEGPRQVELKQGTIPFFDIQIAYKLYDVVNPGPAEEARLNPTAIFLHGAKYASDYWLQLGTLKIVAEAGVRAMAIDLPGFGATPALPYSDNNMRAELLKTVIEAAWPRVNSSVYLISPSMSGRYSIPFLDRHGVMITSFVAVAPIGVRDWGGPWEDTHRKVCALAVYGSKDPLAKDADRLLRLFQYAWKVVIPGAGHRSYEDKPEVFHKLSSRLTQGCRMVMVAKMVLVTFLRKCRRTRDSGHNVEGESGIELVKTLRAAEAATAR